MMKLKLLINVHSVFDAISKRTKIYKNAERLTLNASLLSKSSSPSLAPQSLAMFGRESERGDKLGFFNVV